MTVGPCTRVWIPEAVDWRLYRRAEERVKRHARNSKAKRFRWNQGGVQGEIDNDWMAMRGEWAVCEMLEVAFDWEDAGVTDPGWDLVKDYVRIDVKTCMAPKRLLVIPKSKLPLRAQMLCLCIDHRANDYGLKYLRPGFYNGVGPGRIEVAGFVSREVFQREARHESWTVPCRALDRDELLPWGG